MERLVETIHFYHTNDIHSHFDSWPQISRYLLSQKQFHALEKEASYCFDIGDHVDRSHPFTEGTSGKGNVALLNSAGYDAVTIGNNEGITMSKKELNTLYEGADFDVILCNLVETDGSTLKWMKRFKIYKTDKGTRIGVIGATAMYEDFYSKLGWLIEEPRTAIKKVVKQIQDDVDIIICLSHLGVHEDRLLTEECEEIDVIFGAHTHHLFLQGEMVNNTLLAATGKFGEYVGHVTVQIDLEEKRVIGKNASVLPVKHFERREEDIREVNELVEAGNEAMAEKVFYNTEPLSQQLFSESSLSSFFGKALLAYSGADCAMFNAGIFLGSLDHGWITKGDLHRLLPHPINLCVISLNGSELIDVFNQSQNKEWPEIEIKGLGFRGTLMGKMIFERLFMNECGELIVGTQKVLEGQVYKLATLDMFTFGYFFPILKDSKKDYYMPELIRDIVAWYGKRQAMEDLGLIDVNE